MCGIIGYVGYRPCQEILFDGLKRLEYRGYDSAGLAWRENGHVERVRAVGNLGALQVALAVRRTVETQRAQGERATEIRAGSPQIGIGHTRWATHGAVTEQNAHPHSDARGRVWIVLNGIIENYIALRGRLERDLITCSSDTDAEVLAHLIGRHYEGELVQAFRRALGELEGQYAFVAMCEDEPDTLVAVRREAPLVLGLGHGEQFVASSIAAFLTHTRDVAVLRDGELAVVRPNDVRIAGTGDLARPPVRTTVDWEQDRVEKECYETSMLKEIHEQGDAIAETLSGLRRDLASATHPALSDDGLRRLSRVLVIACGTSFHAGLAGQLAIERWARIPHPLGNLVIRSLAGAFGSLEDAAAWLGEQLGISASVLPATTGPVELVADTDAGVVRGETGIGPARTPIRRLHFEPMRPATPAAAVAAIEQADWVLIAPGSLFTSTLAAAALSDVAVALMRTRARVLWISNLISERYETAGMSAADHLAMLRAHGIRIDAVLYDPTAELRFTPDALAAERLPSLESTLEAGVRGIHDPRLLRAALSSLVDLR